ncbi:MAG: hypothetical protein Kow0079_14180 [Vicingaceae bacterium]
MRSLIVYIILSFTALNLSAHEYFVSIWTIHYNEKTSKFEITIKCTAHDVEHALVDAGIKPPLHIEKHPQADSLLNDYVQHQFNIKIGKEDCPYIYIGKELEPDETLYLYFETEKFDLSKEVTINCTFLVDTFKDQQNIIHIEYLGKTVSKTFTKNITNHQFKLQ